ncbi:MAG: GTPase domain-containing protein [Candidatus Njordarchaeia archaeon]|nr:GTPase domain-containing protein [Candidatus Korarchaeota archaeon]
MRFLTRKKSISIFGIRAVGKTAYISMLVNILSNQQNIKKLRVLSGYDYYMQMMNWILRGEGPPPNKTYERLLIHLSMEVDGKKIELRTYDVAGGDIERMGDVFKALIDVGDGYLFLVEPTRDPDKHVTQVKLIYKLIEYLTEKFKKRTKKPLALAFTKNDIYGIKDPKKAFFEYTVPVFNLSQVFYYLKNYEFFAVSAFGGDLEQIRSEGRTATPIDIEKPFFWLLKQI